MWMRQIRCVLLLAISDMTRQRSKIAAHKYNIDLECLNCPVVGGCNPNSPACPLYPKYASWKAKIEYAKRQRDYTDAD